MPIDPSVVDRVARLARLELSDEERQRFARQLGSILEYCATLNELGDDVAGTPLPRDAVLAAAPDHEDGFFKVPPIIETE
ncbi:MAG: aspartyl/glutamyl-tRNA amidotransferase subunit C [Bacillati bacterium ANGP1]|uniref:Aspartyl/glutamyl-tRNA(Asn/Gln) amidotransferase subunit C n=1 Tax=Candidatus Segetimicrobium genomatis TaxID=2569760 RepID=A0A537KRR0_9BACT|nr:MAG: aspartyl/glutamyl-tRNA amidotransferase subunit C [Terrabacteria group bacterium ANGP1]